MLTLRGNYIRAALCCAGVDDPSRGYLNGICIEVGLDFVNYIGTDGAALFACGHANDPKSDPPSDALIGKSLVIPRNALSRVKASNFYLVVEEIDTSVIKVHEHHHTKKGRFLRSEPQLWIRAADDYPKWRQVVPRTPSNENAAFCKKLLGKIALAFDELLPEAPNSDGGKCVIYPNGQAAAALVLHHHVHDAFGLVMPFRADEEIPIAPRVDWIDRPLQRVESVA